MKLRKVVSEKLSGENQFTSSVKAGDSKTIAIGMSSDDLVADIEVQKSYDNENWFVKKQYNGGNRCFEIENDHIERFYRVGIRKGNYESGTVNVSILKEWERK